MIINHLQNGMILQEGTKKGQKRDKKGTKVQKIDQIH